MKEVGQAAQEYIRARTRKDVIDDVQTAKDDGSLDEYLHEQKMFSNAAVAGAKKKLAEVIEAE